MHIDLPDRHPFHSLAVAAVTSLSALVRAQGRTEMTINDTGVQAENLTSSQDGIGVLRQHGERHDLPGRAGRGTSRTLDSGVDRRPDQRARRARGRQDQHVVGLPEQHWRPRRRARGRTDRASLI